MLFVIGALTISACGADSGDTNTEQNQNKEEGVNQESALNKEDAEKNDSIANSDAEGENGQGINSRYAYDQDWNNIKEAILTKNQKELLNYCIDDEEDVELLIDQIHMDADLLSQLRSMSYDDLLSQEGPTGEMMLVAALAVSGVEEGIEYESGIYIYMEQGDPSLMIATYLAAG